MLRFDQKHKLANRVAPVETTTAQAPTVRLHLGESDRAVPTQAGSVRTTPPSP